MKPVDEDAKNKVTDVMRYFKDHKKEIKTRLGYRGGFETEKFSIDDTGTQYNIVFNTLTLFSSIKATIFESGSFLTLEEVSIIKSRAAIVPGHFFLVDRDLYDYILYKIRKLKLDNGKDDSSNEIADFEIEL